MNKIDFQKRQVARRRTLFPLSARQVHEERVNVAQLLHMCGLRFREIRQVLNLSGPEEARRLVAKANYLNNKGR